MNRAFRRIIEIMGEDFFGLNGEKFSTLVEKLDVVSIPFLAKSPVHVFINTPPLRFFKKEKQEVPYLIITPNSYETNVPVSNDVDVLAEFVRAIKKGLRFDKIILDINSLSALASVLWSMGLKFPIRILVPSDNDARYRALVMASEADYRVIVKLNGKFAYKFGVIVELFNAQAGTRVFDFDRHSAGIDDVRLFLDLLTHISQNTTIYWSDGGELYLEQYHNDSVSGNGWEIVKTYFIDGRHSTKAIEFSPEVALWKLTECDKCATHEIFTDRGDWEISGSIKDNIYFTIRPDELRITYPRL